MLTVAFLIFNMTAFVKFMVVNLGGIDWGNSELQLVMIFTFPLLNALANPAILIARSTDLVSVKGPLLRVPY